MPKSKYDPKFCEIAAQMGKEGATYEEIAQALGISVPLLRQWERTRPEFFEAMTHSYVSGLRRQIANDVLERATEATRKLAAKTAQKTARKDA